MGRAKETVGQYKAQRNANYTNAAIIKPSTKTNKPARIPLLKQSWANKALKQYDRRRKILSNSELEMGNV